VLFSSARGYAQVGLQVTVLDAESREPVPSLRVDLTNLETGTTRSELTNGVGKARFGGLETGGRWQAATESTDRFESVASEPLVLRSRFEASVTLLVPRTRGPASDPPGEGAVDARVERVEARAGRISPRMNTTSSEVSATLTEDELDRIPVLSQSLDNVLFRLPFVTRSTGFFPEAPAAAINGANALFTNYTIDGLDNNENFLGGLRFPVQLGMVQDVTVLASNYSVEYGRTANGVVNVTTKSGGNEFEASTYFLTRPGLNADTDFPLTDLQGNPVNPDFQRYQFGASVSGPIVKDQTFFFVHGEYLLDLLDNQLTVPQLGIDEEIRGENQQFVITARVDHDWSERWSSTLRVNHGRVSNVLPGGGVEGGVTFPSAGSDQERLSTNVAFSTTYSGDVWDYTGAVQYSRFDWDYRRALNGPGPQVSLQDPTGTTIGILGHPGFIFEETENTFQTQHKFEVEAGRQRFKFGADVIIADFSLVGGGNPNGNRVVRLDQKEIDALSASGIGSALAPEDITGGTVLSDVYETQPNAFGTNQQLYALYAEDQIQVSPKFTVTAGIRWDFDSLSTANGAASGDFDNFAPRAGFNWSVAPNLVLRGGAGLFYEKIPYAVVSDAIQQSSTSEGFRAQLEELQDQGIIAADAELDDLVADGNLAVDGAGRCSTPESCAEIREELTSPERRIQNPEGLDNPFAVQTTVGVQWQFLRSWMTSVDLIYSEGFNLLRLVDLNAPAPFEFNQALYDELGPEGVAALSEQERRDLGLVRSPDDANATRPAPIRAGGARSIIVSDTGGRSRYVAMNVALYKDRGSDLYDFTLFYTLSRLENDTDDINFRASDSNNFDRDWGPSLNDRTHVFSSIVSLYPLEGLTLSVAGLLQSGAPVNFTPNAEVFGTTDINGDGLSFADQFTGNPDRAPGFDRNSGRLDWSFNLDVSAQYALDVFGGHLILAAQVFNLLNLNNQSGYPVNFTASNSQQVAGQPFVQRSADIPLTAQFSLEYRY